MPLTVIIADDHALFRQGLKSLLLLREEVAVVGEVHSADEIRPVLLTHPCDILLLDLQMDRWSMEDIPQLAALTRIIVLTASENAETGLRALRLGARAVVYKRFAIETLITAIQAVAEGMVWMPPSVQTHFARDHSSNRQLTAREEEIVRRVAAGMRNAQVARALSISESTVKTHLNNIFQKLGLRDRIELTHYAIKTGLAHVLDDNR